ncbi:MAG: ROK family transcriptional regulator [Propionibacteriales bacterium]|nr:ROK family transcriptional regulator [Propionibacteriales bacterium]
MPRRNTWSLDATSQAVAREVLRRGPLSRAELARQLHLSGPSVSRIVKPLVASGLLLEEGPARLTRTGRPSVPLRFNERLGLFCGLGIGVDSLQVVVSSVTGRVLHERDYPLDTGRPEVAVVALAKAIEWARQREPLTAAVGISIPGIVESNRIVRRSRRLGWSDVDLVGLLRRETDLSIMVSNDFHALTVAEHWFGFGLEYESFLALIIDGVVGAGVVVNDRLAQESDGRGGLVGHNLVLPGGPVCPQGHIGCADGLLTRRALAEQFGAAFGRDVSYDEGVALAERGDETSRRVLTRAAEGLAVLIGELCNLMGHSNVVVTGDGARWVALVHDQLVADVEARQIRGDATMQVDIRCWGPSDWGRAGAIAAIRYCPFMDTSGGSHI